MGILDVGIGTAIFASLGITIYLIRKNGINCIRLTSESGGENA